MSSIETQVSHMSIPKGNLGQPTHHTHPHLISQEHLTCGVTQAEYKERRERLVNKLLEEVVNIHTTHIVSFLFLFYFNDISLDI